jgi:hypothetical protein
MKKDVTELLVEKEFMKWLRDNHSLYEDITELNWMIEHFKIMYGITLTITYENNE